MNLFGSSGIRGPVGDEITADLALSIGRAVASGNIETVVVGRDVRESGTILLDAVAAGVRECGADVIDIGIVSTPTLARSVDWQDADAGIMITASHNPASDNGIKLWTPSGRAFDTDQQAAIQDRIENNRYDLQAWDALGDYSTESDVSGKHVDELVKTITEGKSTQTPLEGLSVIVDLGNGTGQPTVDALIRLGADVETINAQPDGRFPSRPSKPTAANCHTLCRAVAETDATLGIAHDGDADRTQAVTESGEFVSGDTLLALFARAIASKGDKVAAPLNISLAVDEVLAEKDASLVRTRIGDVHVAEHASNPEVIFGGEQSGAYIWPEEVLCPDGPLAACKLAALIVEKGPLSQQVESIPTYPHLSDAYETDRKRELISRIEEHARSKYDEESITTVDGVHIAFEEGWILIRASGTESLIRYRAEARSQSDAERLFEEATSLLNDAL